MVEVKGKQINPRYTVGALEEYYELTGEDILFSGGNMDTPSKRSAFVYVGLKHEGITREDFDDMTISEFNRILEECLKVLAKDVGGDVKPGEDEIKKN